MTAATFIRIGAICGKTGVIGGMTEQIFAATGAIFRRNAVTCARTCETAITKTPVATGAIFARISAICEATAATSVLTAAIPALIGGTFAPTAASKEAVQVSFETSSMWATAALGCRTPNSSFQLAHFAGPELAPSTQLSIHLRYSGLPSSIEIEIISGNS